MTDNTEKEIDVFKRAVEKYAPKLKEFLSMLQPLAEQEKEENSRRITSLPQYLS